MPNVGALAGWATVVILLIVAWLTYRGGGGSALNVVETANRVLERRNHALEAQAIRDQTVIADLQTRTDIVAAVQPLTEAFAAYQAQADRRAEVTHALLVEIRDRLGGQEVRA